MLYIYHVDVGHLFAFDMDLAMKKVRDLKKEIEKMCGIPYINQVLVVSGGQIMDGKRVVGSYQTGTDNNPVWLVDNRMYNQNQAPVAYIPDGPDDRLKEYLQNSMQLPPTYDTIVTRAQLSMRFYENGREEYGICEVLVKDQHFQHQGWAALKCTLEDKGIALKKNRNRFLKSYDQYLSQRETALEQLKQYENTRILIRKIPIPECLDHYAKKCTDRLMRESTLPTSERRISNFVSCVDKLDKSEYSSGSGPPSLSESADTHRPRHQPDGVSSAVQRSSPVLIRKKSATDKASAASSSESLGERSASYGTKFKLSSSVPEQREDPNLTGFTSPGIQSPCATPKKLSHIQEEEDGANGTSGDARTGKGSHQGVVTKTGTSDPKTIKFEISPTASQSSSQSSLHEPRSLSPSPARRKTLSDWIRGNDSKDPIDMVKKELDEKFVKLTPEKRGELVAKCDEDLRALDNKSMKEFKGLDRRLAGLEQLMMQMKDLVTQQSDMAQGFIQNQQRARTERDASVLPDLCVSHRKQLHVMIENHQRLCDIKRRITNAKQELCTVLHARIRWIMHMEEKLREVDNDIIMTQGMLGRLFSYMKTLKQVHETPALFAEAVVEGYRRKRFTTKFMEWADSWALENRALYEKEIERRKEFNHHFSGHFLLRMFTGYGEEPPSFATTVPAPFDMELPAIAIEDIEMLRQEVPEIAQWLNVPEDIDIGKMVPPTTASLRAISSSIFIPLPEAQDSISATTTDQATSYCLTGSIQDDNTSDIVVLNANGEQGTLTPSPTHRPTFSNAMTSVSSLHSSQSSVHHRDIGTSPDAGMAEMGSLTQSVEVITTADAVMPPDAKQGYSLPFQAYEAGRGIDPRSLSVQEPRSADASPTDAELAFHSLRSLSLDDVQLSRDLTSPQLGTSPDLEDFATADFYIEESIPSAMSASSPDKTITELQLQLEDKCGEVVLKDGELQMKDEELQTLRDDNAKSQAQVDQLNQAISIILQGFSNKETLGLTLVRQQLDDIRCDSVQLRDQFLSDVADFGRTIQQRLEDVTQENQRVANENKQLQQELDSIKQQTQDKEKHLELKMEESVCVISEEWEHKLKSANDQLTQDKQRHYEMISDLTSQLKSQQEEIISVTRDGESKCEEMRRDQQQKVVTMQGTHEKEVVTLGDELQSQKDKVQTLNIEKTEMSQKLGVESEKLQKTENQVKVIDEETLMLKEKIDNLEKLKLKLETSLKSTKDECDIRVGKLQGWLDSKTLEVRNLEDSTGLLEQTIADMREKYERQLSDDKLKIDEREKDLEEHKVLLQDRTQEFKNKCKSLAEEKSIYELKLAELEKELKLKLTDVRKEGQEELHNTRSELMLEHEVEMEKVRSDLEIEVSFKEQELDNLKADLEQTQKRLEQITTEKEQVQEKLQLQFQNEKAEIIKMLEKEALEKLQKQESELREVLIEEEKCRVKALLKEKAEENERLLEKTKEEVQTQNQAAIDELTASHQKELEDQYLQSEEKLDQLRKQLSDEFEGQRERERLQLSENKKEILSAIESEKEKEMKELKESLAFDFHKRITELRSDIEKKEQEIQDLRAAVRDKEDQLQRVKEDPNLLTLEKHNALIQELKSGAIAEKEKCIQKAITESEASHKQEIDSLIERLEKDKQDSLGQMKTSLTGDKQVLFNEALNKVVSEKDKVISDLKQRLEETETSLEAVKSEMVKTEQSLAEKTRDDQGEMRVAMKKYEEEILSQRQQLQMMSSNISMTSSVMSQSVIPIAEGSSVLQDKILQLEMELKTKEQEIVKLKDKLQEKMGELSISPATQNLVKDKISITSCTKGDVVLLCLDDKYDHYVVFTVGTTLHFLHSDCLEALNLRPVAGEQRRLWVLAEIIEKEYCQAKKAQNRFKVPQGTKFYRVRCKPWSHPSMTASTVAASHQLKAQHGGATTSKKQQGTSSKSSSAASVTEAGPSSTSISNTERQDSTEACSSVGEGSNIRTNEENIDDSSKVKSSSHVQDSGNVSERKWDVAASGKSGVDSEGVTGGSVEVRGAEGGSTEEKTDVTGES